MTHTTETLASGAQTIADEAVQSPTYNYIKHHLQQVTDDLATTINKVNAMDREYDMQIEALKKKLMNIEKLQLENPSFVQVFKTFLMRKMNANSRPRTQTAKATRQSR